MHTCLSNTHSGCCMRGSAHSTNTLAKNNSARSRMRTAPLYCSTQSMHAGMANSTSNGGHAKATSQCLLPNESMYNMAVAHHSIARLSAPIEMPNNAQANESEHANKKRVTMGASAKFAGRVSSEMGKPHAHKNGSEESRAISCASIARASQPLKIFPVKTVSISSSRRCCYCLTAAALPWHYAIG